MKRGRRSLGRNKHHHRRTTAAPRLRLETLEARQLLTVGVVINEIHYNPDVKTEAVEFVELYNNSGAQVDLSGWSFDGITYTFPIGTLLPAGGYVTVAENPTAFQTKFATTALGPFTGNLDNDGENLQLLNASQGVEDEVDYQRGFPWPTIGNPPGYSIELINPSLDNGLGGSWRSFTPAANTTLISSGSSWRYLKGTAANASGLGATWRPTGVDTFDDSAWPSGTSPIGYDPSVPMGTSLSDMNNGYTSAYMRKTFSVTDPNAYGALRLEALYDDGFNLWINGVPVKSQQMPGFEVAYNSLASGPARESASFDAFVLSNPAPSSYLRAGTNVIDVQFHNILLNGSSDAFFDARLFGMLGSGTSPSPGRVNSVYSPVAPPQIRQVENTPQQPASNQPVLVTAHVSDPNGMGAVTLDYQLVNPGDYIELADPRYATSWTTVSMNDAGTDGDALAADGVFSVTLPASLQTHRRLVRYRITAADSLGASIRVPYADDPQPNFAYFVYDGVPAWSGAIQPGSADPVKGAVVTYSGSLLSSIPTYQLLTTRSDHVESQHIPNATSASYSGDNYLWQGALVYDGKVYDHINYRARGGVWRYAMGKNMWKFDFNTGHDFEARDEQGNKYDVGWTKLNLGANIQQGDFLHRGEQGLFESVGFRLFNLAGVEAPETHYVQFRIVDQASETGANQYSGDFQGLYLAVEQQDGRFLDEHDLPDGNLYKMEGGTGDANNIGPTGPTDKSDLNSFLNTYTTTTPTDQWWRDNLDLEGYYSYRAIVEGIHHYDIGDGKNYFYFHNPLTNKWQVLPWDLDLTWANNMYGSGNEPFKSRVIDTRVTFQREYRNRLREIRDLLFNTEQTNQLIAEYAAFVDTPANGPSLVDADRAMWDYNPIMINTVYVNSSKAGQGRFYQQATTKDFPGIQQIMRNYVVTRSGVIDGTLITVADENAAPVRPTITYAGPAGFPLNQLTFNTSAYAPGPSGGGSFAAMEWRLAEVTDVNAPVYDPTDTKHYEITAEWESGELTTFGASATIPAGIANEGHAYRARVRFKDSNGRWSHWSQPVQFIATASTSDLVESLRVTEVMYHPQDPAPPGSAFDPDEYEFIELKNTGNTTLDLRGVQFTNGIAYTFPTGGPITSLEPSGHVVVVRNLAAFQERYGTGIPVAGEYVPTALSNGGENVELKSALGEDILDFTYFDDEPDWQPSTDGPGRSLVILDASAGRETWDLGASWRASCDMWGSPGADDPTLAGFVFADTDASGTRAGGESGLAGVNVKLYNAGGDGQVGGGDDALLDTVLTTASGGYQFVAVPPGTFYMYFSAPPGYTFSPQNQGGDDSLDSDVDALGRTAVFTLLAGQTDATRFAGLVPALSATVVGRHVFYNNSSWDGNDAGANAADDDAIATDKTALLPGGTAALANYTSFNKGINGVMIDVANLAGTITAGDFTFKTGNANDTSTWTTLATAPSVSVRPGAGTSGSDRVTLIWPDGTIKKQWLQVTVLANGNSGLADDDVFYFGNAIGEAGNAVGDAQVNAADELGARGNPRNIANPAPITFLYDYNRDKQVNAADQLISRGNPTNLATRLVLITPTPTALLDKPAVAPAAAGVVDAAIGDLEGAGSDVIARRRQRR